jgi:glucose 1-dehydrogenase
MKLSNKKAIITGASRGIGKAIAIQLARDGAEVIIHYHTNKEEAENVADLINSTGGKSHILKADLADPDQAIQLGEQGWRILKGIDYLINNAGVCYKRNFLDTTLTDVDFFVNINFRGTLLLTQTIAKKMIEENVKGSIYTITSVNAIQPGVGFSVYGATKGALETIMKGIALELAPYNIKVNTIVAGAIQTDINAEVWQNPDKRKSVESVIPMGRFGNPEEIAKCICGLLSSGSYITGSSIKIDGGWLLNTGYSGAGETL